MGWMIRSARLAALVRGYLTRRLLATDQVRDQLQTIRDTRACLRELDRGSLKVNYTLQLQPVIAMTGDTKTIMLVSNSLAKAYLLAHICTIQVQPWTL